MLDFIDFIKFYIDNINTNIYFKNGSWHHLRNQRS